jgi:ATP-dependent Lhr-like helicase
MEVDPYRIQLRTPRRVPPKLVADIITGTDPGAVRPLLERSLRGSGLLRWKLFHVARKFGVIDKDADNTVFSYERLLAALDDTPVVEEAVRDLLNDSLDAVAVEGLLKSVRDGEVTVVTCGPTPLGEAGTRGSLDLIVPENADRSIINALRRRIDSDRVLLFCTNCRRYSHTCRVGGVPERVECPVCGSTMVAALKPWEKEETELVIRESRSTEDKRRIRRVIQNAALVSSHGRRAVVTLAARGLGPTASARVLRRQREEDDFYRDILTEEKKYSRTQKFWD